MAQEPSWWVRHKQVLVTILLIVLVLGILALGYLFLPHWLGFGRYTDPNGEFHPAKTLWDWMDLLVVPLVLAIGVYWLNRQEREAERKPEERRARNESEMAADRERQNALQAYLDHMTHLILEKKLQTSGPDSEIRDIARARTLTVLRALDGKRKGMLVQFLCESGLIDRGEKEPPVYLYGADLQEADLRGADLSGTNLVYVDLSHANLRRSDLSEADLSLANLTGADLRSAFLIRTTLSQAIITNEQLAQARSLEGAVMCEVAKND